jgi:G patch domain-containing protein 1
MAHKRSRAAFEADLQAQQSPFVLFGTPLPPLDPDVRDDGSYVPVWKQDVRDERGRRRLHGAFTGGWSAGYFNTVGSKEGWTPSTFVSSRSNRRKDGQQQQQQQQQRPEDFMDEEDLADKAESEKLRTASAFVGLGSTEADGARRGALADLFRLSGETMGSKLLKRMGWKEGQGIGPKVRRKARLDVGGKPGGNGHDDGKTHLFAPENVQLITIVKKLDRKGLGFAGEAKLTPISSGNKKMINDSSDEDGEDGPLIRPSIFKKKSKPVRGGIGIGILNDTGSDDEDPYEIGPKISYNKVIGGDKKKKKAPNTTSANPSLRSAPVFISKKSALAKAGKNLRKCHDGRLPLDGFNFGTNTEELATTIHSQGKYPPPKIPADWKPARQRGDGTDGHSYISTADAAKASTLDPKSRAELLGEAQLPGKSVFDFLNPAARDRLAAATGKVNLPPALGEIPAGYALTPEEKQRELLAQVPKLEKETAIAAITRGASGSTPYADDESKRIRYRAYLEYSAGFSKAALPAKPPGQSNEEWLCELREFHSCAMIFRPMTGLMASRFTTSSSKFIGGNQDKSAGGHDAAADVLSKPAPKPTDPAEDAAKLGMYGPLTRSVSDFYPTRLLCRRFNVPPPAHVQPNPETAEAMKGAGGGSGAGMAAHGFYGAAASTFGDMMGTAAGNGTTTGNSSRSGGAITLDELLMQAQAQSDLHDGKTKDIDDSNTARPTPAPSEMEIDASVNDAVEGKRAQDDVLRAIFGDSSDEED